MVDLDTRRAILALKQKGHGIRAIARALQVSRKSVRKVLREGVDTVPRLERVEQAEPWLGRIRELHELCEGNLVRVHEELEAEGKSLAYSTLTAFCRRHDIGVKRKERKGTYHFAPGEEMQHDTSPHKILIGGEYRKYECASLVECHSRMRFVQVYPEWNRFNCKVFLQDAFIYFGGCAWRIMVDNHSVVIARGSGANAIVAPEMEAFVERFSSKFLAHEPGDANRSARVEGPFWHVERNFYPGRKFPNLTWLNRDLLAWCDRDNGKFKRSFRARPIDLFVASKAALRPLPIHIPEVYELHHRLVDLEGFVTVHRNRYSVPEELLGRRMTVRETKDRIRIFDGHREVTVPERELPGAGVRCILNGHHQPRSRRRRREPTPEELVVRRAGPLLCRYVDALQHKHGGRAARAVRELHRLYVEYPAAALNDAIDTALNYRMLDLKRLERMVLRGIAKDFFRASDEDDTDG